MAHLSIRLAALKSLQIEWKLSFLFENFKYMKNMFLTIFPKKFQIFPPENLSPLSNNWSRFSKRPFYDRFKLANLNHFRFRGIQFKFRFNCIKLLPLQTPISINWSSISSRLKMLQLLAHFLYFYFRFFQQKKTKFPVL